jgi:hypothetical protein
MKRESRIKLVRVFFLAIASLFSAGASVCAQDATSLVVNAAQHSAEVGQHLPEYIAIYFICRSPIELFFDAFWDGGYFYTIFITLIIALLGLLWVNFATFSKHKCGGALLAINLSITFSFIYLSILSYAYHIYPYIPTSRGGGDYSADERTSFVTFKNESVSSVPKELVREGELQSNPLTILEDTPSEIFVTLECTTE